MLCIATLIKLQDGQPPIFRQRRIGLEGKPFTMLKFRSVKFRSVVVAADDPKARLMGLNEGDTYTFSQFTPLGKFLYDFALDELPNLFNVLRGTMSLVGPRPRLRTEASQPAMDRATVRPGLTGLWQTSGLPGSRTEDAGRLDREYAKYWSLWLDIKIMIKTVIALFRTRA